MSHVQHLIFISSECPFQTLGAHAQDFFYIIIIIYMTTKVNRLKMGVFKFKKIIKKIL